MEIDHPSQPGNFAQNDIYSSPPWRSPPTPSLKTALWKIFPMSLGNPRLGRSTSKTSTLISGNRMDNPSSTRRGRTKFATTSSLAINPADEASALWKSHVSKRLSTFSLKTEASMALPSTFHGYLESSGASWSRDWGMAPMAHTTAASTWSGVNTKNGLELWKELSEENEGGAEQIALGGLRRVHKFPQCPHKQLLGHYLGEWAMLKNKHASNLPDANRWTMLMSMLPEDVQKVIDDLNGELSRYQDSWLSKTQERIKSKTIQHAPKNPVNAVYDAEPMLSDLHKLKEDLGNAVNAVTQTRPQDFIMSTATSTHRSSPTSTNWCSP